MVETDTNLIKYRLLPHPAAPPLRFFRALPAAPRFRPRICADCAVPDFCRPAASCILSLSRSAACVSPLPAESLPPPASPPPSRCVPAAAAPRAWILSLARRFHPCLFPLPLRFSARFPVLHASPSRNDGSCRLKMTVFSVMIAIFNIFFLSLRAIVRNRDNYKQNKQITTNFFHANAKQRFH